MKPVEVRPLTDAELREIVVRSELEWNAVMNGNTPTRKIGLRRAMRDREMLVAHILCTANSRSERL